MGVEEVCVEEMRIELSHRDTHNRCDVGILVDTGAVWMVSERATPYLFKAKNSRKGQPGLLGPPPGHLPPNWVCGRMGQAIESTSVIDALRFQVEEP